jgi:hypothetical protein
VVDGTPLRAVEVTRLTQGGFLATLDGQPVAGAGFYRAVLRPDLAARAEQARFDRTALLVAAGVAPLAGLGAGWVWATSQARAVPDCAIAPIPVGLGGSGVSACERVRAQNRSTMTTGLVVGGLTGLAVGGVLWVLGSGLPTHTPTAEEAEALARAYRARAAPAPDPAPVGDRQGGGASLELEAGPGAARLALLLRF